MRNLETIDNIKTDEGYRESPYLCSEKQLTWLYGRNISANPITEREWQDCHRILLLCGTVEEWADKLFRDQVRMHMIELNLPYFDDLPEEVQAIIHNMAYNMGTRRFNPGQWPKFFKAVESEKWEKAAKEMENSRWYHQVKRRAKRLVKAMRAQKEIGRGLE